MIQQATADSTLKEYHLQKAENGYTPHQKKKKYEYVEYFHGTCEIRSPATNFIILRALTIINSIILVDVLVVMNSALPEKRN